MFIITLRFANKERAPALMDRHNAWIKPGFDDGVFLLVGSIRPDGGGVIMAHNAPRAAVEARVQSDPFVAGGVVHADIVEIAPNRTEDRLGFLKV